MKIGVGDRLKQVLPTEFTSKNQRSYATVLPYKVIQENQIDFGKHFQKLGLSQKAACFLAETQEKEKSRFSKMFDEVFAEFMSQKNHTFQPKKICNANQPIITKVKFIYKVENILEINRTP